MTMRERRKHKSLWNMEEEETNHLSGMRKHDIEHLSSNGNNKRRQEFPASRNSPGFASTDHWHSIADKNQSASINESCMRSRHEIFEGKKIIEGKRYYKDMTPEKTNEETRKYDEARDYNRDHRHAQRYPVRGRSRSRSRSRSKSRGNTRDRLRDDSPTRDQRRLSHAWSDRRSSHEKSPQACRNFSLGKCNRGSQCRFSHSDNRINRRDGDNIQDDDDAGTWRDRADHRSSGLASRADDVLSESYRSRSSRSDVPCKDFVRGNCRWGDSCRFSHHVESDEFSRGSKKGNFDKGNERQSWRPFHKSFSSPMSDRENNREGVVNDDKCSTRDLRKRWDGPTWDDVDKPSEPVRISGWGEPTLTNLNVTVESNIGERDDKWGHTDEDKPCEKRWDGPTWDDVDKPAEPVRINGWGEPTLTNLNVTVESNIGEKDDKWGHTLRNETRSWEIPENADSISNVGKQPHRRSNKTISADDLANKEQLLLDMSQLQNRNGAINVYESNALQVCQSISEVPHQSRRLVINLAKSHVSEVHEEAKGPTIPTVLKVDLSEHYPDLSRGDISSEPCSISNGAYTEQNLLSFDKSNGLSTHQHSVPSDLRSQKVDQLSGILEPKPPHISTDSLPVESDTARVTNSADQVENSSSIEKIHSFTDTSGSMALLKTETSQLHSIPPSLDLSSCSKNVTSNTEQSGFRTRPDLEHSSLRPLVCDTSVMNLQENPNLRQESKVVVANSKVAEENRVIDKETEDIEGNKGTKTVEGQGKTEEGCITEKDDKGTRMFKNALIEFVKDILKPAWKEGRMSREVHKTVVKKVVDKVSTSIQAEHVPRTQDKVEHYLSFSKSKITKLVQAYVERCHKAETTGVTK